MTTLPDLELYARALDGTLRSTADGNPAAVVVTNETPSTLRLFLVSTGGMLCGVDAEGWVEGAPGVVLTPQSNPTTPYTIPDVQDGTCFVVLLEYSGAFVAAFKKTSDSTQLVVDGGVMLDPGMAGPVPEPSTWRPIPVDSPRIVVGYGVAPEGGVMTREQYWRLSPDSYSLAPGERVTTSVTNVAGLESTSSDQTTMSASIGASTSAGWGPVSMSISASLSASSTTMQQVTINDQTTAFRSSEKVNESPDAVTYFLWQLTDVVTVFNADGIATATTVTGIQPMIVSGPRYAKELPPTPLKTRVLRDARLAGAAAGVSPPAAPRR